MRTNSDEKFLILARFKKFVIDLDPVIDRLPKKDYMSRNDLFNLILSTIKLINLANYENDYAIKSSYQKEILANINTIDFLLERAYKLGYINDAMVNKRSKELKEINSMVYKWSRNAKVQD